MNADQLARARVAVEPDLLHHRARVVFDERLDAGDALVEHDAEREDVAAEVELVAQDLLRAHVARRAHAGAGLGQVAQRVVAGDAEVHQLHLALVGDDDVGRLDVAVDDAAEVRVVERTRDLQRDDRGHLHRQRGVSCSRSYRSMPCTYSMMMYMVSPSLTKS